MNIKSNPNESPYYLLKHRKDQLKNTGFDYKGQILKRTMSRQMFDKNPYLDAILLKLENIWQYLFDEVKSIKTYFNYAADKNEKRII